MGAHRQVRVAEAIRETVATAILSEMADPRVRGVTVLGAQVTGDLRHATIQVSLMGTEGQKRQALRALQNAAGFLQSKVAARLQTRFTPVLTFQVDEGVKKSVAMSRLIEEALAGDRGAQAESETDDNADADPETDETS